MCADGHMSATGRFRHVSNCPVEGCGKTINKSNRY